MSGPPGAGVLGLWCNRKYPGTSEIQCVGCGLRGNLKWLPVEPKPEHCRTRQAVGALGPLKNPSILPACLASRARECSGSGTVGNIPVPGKSSAWGLVYRVTLSGCELNLSPSTAVPGLPGLRRQAVGALGLICPFANSCNLVRFQDDVIFQG